MVRQSLIVMLVTGLLGLQVWLPVVAPKSDLPGHAPLDSCAAAGCACCASHPKGMKCCCTAESHAREAASILERVVADEKCDGGRDASDAMPVLTFCAVLPAVTELPALTEQAWLAPVVFVVVPQRNLSPPVPPPRPALSV